MNDYKKKHEMFLQRNMILKNIRKVKKDKQVTSSTCYLQCLALSFETRFTEL